MIGGTPADIDYVSTFGPKAVAMGAHAVDELATRSHAAADDQDIAALSHAFSLLVAASYAPARVARMLTKR